MFFLLLIEILIEFNAYSIIHYSRYYEHFEETVIGLNSISILILFFTFCDINLVVKIIIFLILFLSKSNLTLNYFLKEGKFGIPFFKNCCIEVLIINFIFMVVVVSYQFLI